MDRHKWLVDHLRIDEGAERLIITSYLAVLYYAPTIFAELGLSGGTTGLLATGVIGIVLFISTIPGALLVDKFGRKPLLMWAEINMTVSHLIIAVLVAKFGSDWASHKGAGDAAIFFGECFVGISGLG